MNGAKACESAARARAAGRSGWAGGARRQHAPLRRATRPHLGDKLGELLGGAVLERAARGLQVGLETRVQLLELLQIGKDVKVRLVREQLEQRPSKLLCNEAQVLEIVGLCAEQLLEHLMQLVVALLVDLGGGLAADKGVGLGQLLQHRAEHPDPRRPHE